MTALAYVDEVHTFVKEKGGGRNRVWRKVWLRLIADRTHQVADYPLVPDLVTRAMSWLGQGDMR